MHQTHIYTTPGPQRPVFLAQGAALAVLELTPGDRGTLYATADPPAQVRQGRARWYPLSNGAAGVQQVTALRACLPALQGWATLSVQDPLTEESHAHV